MKIYKAVYILMFATMVNQIATAQTLKSIYFFDTNPTRHELNPAFATGNGYVGIPLFGNIGFGTHSNIKLSSILYPTSDGQLTTFLDKNISEGQILNQLRRNNAIDGRFNMSILSTGFHKWGGFNTFGLNVKAISRSNIPYDLFAMAKSGMNSTEGNNYNLKRTRHTTDTYGEIAFGHSRVVIKGLRVGGKVKVLLGIASVTANFSQFDATLTQDSWAINSNGTLEVAGATLTSDETGKITGIDEIKPGINGVGLAFDLGMSYEILKDFTVSASVLDLGFMVWNKNIKATTSGDPFIFDGFKDLSVTDENAPNGLDTQLDNLTDDLEALYSFYQAKTGVKSTRYLPNTLNVGVEYGFFRNKLSAGLLSTTGFSKEFIWTDLMLSANYRPAKWFTFALNGSWSNLGWGYGTLINFTSKGFNFFAGVNTMTLRYTPQALPIGRATLYANLGFNVMLKRNDKYEKWRY